MLVVALEGGGTTWVAAVCKEDNLLSLIDIKADCFSGQIDFHSSTAMEEIKLIDRLEIATENPVITLGQILTWLR